MDAILQYAPQMFAETAEKEVEPSFAGTFVYIAFVFVVMFGLMAWAKKGFTNRVFTNPMAWCFEQLYLFIQNLCIGTIGPHGRKYIPMMMTFWTVIFASNVIGLFFPFTPTASLSFNLAMALVAIGYVQYEGIRANGPIGHFSHFAGPKLPIYMIPITLMIFMIEVVSEVMKNVSLSLRLYGNIHGGHEAVSAMNELGHGYVPVGAFLIPIKILTCVVQALIFTLLNCVYLSLVTHHEDDHGHETAAAH